MALGGGAFGKFLGHEGGDLSNRISALKQKGPTDIPTPLHHFTTLLSLNWQKCKRLGNANAGKDGNADMGTFIHAGEVKPSAALGALLSCSVTSGHRHCPASLHMVAGKRMFTAVSPMGTERRQSGCLASSR